MHLIDLLFVIIIILCVIGGWKRGFILEAGGLLIWALSLVGGFSFYPYLTGPLTRMFPSLGVWTLPLALLVTIFLIRLLLGLAFRMVLNILPAWTQDNWLNKFLGIFPGFINGLIISAIVALFLMVLPLSNALSDQVRGSHWADRLTWPAEWFEERLSPVFDEPVKRTVARLGIEPHSEESVKLPYTTTHFYARPDLESEMLEWVNEERTKRGIAPLVADTALKTVARAHSADMFERGYFSHVTPEGQDPFDRMRAAHIRFVEAGENLALAQTLSIAHTGLMHSPGHRANILNPEFHRMGIGIMEGGVHGLMISQEFRN